MPDAKGNTSADEDTSTPLHAYRDNRPGDIKGDPTGTDVISDEPKDGVNPA